MRNTSRIGLTIDNQSTGPTTADPVRSLWQTASTGIRMILPVSWTMARTGMVQWIDTTTY